MQIVIGAAPQGMLDNILPRVLHSADCCLATAAADNIMAAEEEKCGAL